MNCVVSESAKNDLAGQSQWYARHADEAIAERYLSSFQRTLAQLTAQPDLGHLRHFRDVRLTGLRSLAMDGSFRVHLIFYRMESDTLVVFRVMHGMRDLRHRLLQASEEEH